MPEADGTLQEDELTAAQDLGGEEPLLLQARIWLPVAAGQGHGSAPPASALPELLRPGTLAGSAVLTPGLGGPDVPGEIEAATRRIEGVTVASPSPFPGEILPSTQGKTTDHFDLPSLPLAAAARGETREAPSAAGFSVPERFPSPPWEASFQSRVLWMVKEQVQFAELQLNPPHLGPVEVKITLQNHEASISFGSQQVLVREAIELALPRLREALGESGVHLMGVDVSGHSPGQDHSQSGFDRERRGQETEEEELTLRFHEGLIDHYV
jgi:hypothetical protein